MSSPPIEPGFMVVHGNKPESLRQLLISWYQQYPLAPLENEIILVQSNGIAQWLKLSLASTASADGLGGIGVAAAIDAKLPSSFVWQIYRAVLGEAAVPEESAFDKRLMVWRLMRLIPTLTHLPEFAPLARFLAHDDELIKRYQLAEKIADLFDQYQVYRADWMHAWATGRDVLLNTQLMETPLQEEQRWQAILWRQLLADMGELQTTSRAALHVRCTEALSSLSSRPAKLPRRITVFGLSSLPKQTLEILVALSRHAQIFLCVQNPCEHYWADVISARDYSRQHAGRHARKHTVAPLQAADSMHIASHPLLAAWGKLGRDYVALLDELDQPQHYRDLFLQSGHKIDLFESHGTSCLLNQLQEDIHQLRNITETRAHWAALDASADTSIRFHIAHSPQREVEILHDQLLDALNHDATLRPRDVIVMVPDIQRYAPHIQAVFGQLDISDDRYIPFSISDLGNGQLAPVFRALNYLLNLQESRLTAADVLDLLDVPAVRTRFGITEDGLAILERWIDQSRIRWGLNSKHRQYFFNGELAQNSWSHGLKRMLLGYAVGADPTDREDRSWHDIEPQGEVAGLDAALVGPLFMLIETLEHWLVELAQPTTAEAWQERGQRLIHDFFQSSSSTDTAHILELQTSLNRLTQSCKTAGMQETLSLAVVKTHWLAQLDQPSLSQRFMAGRLTFATLMPMRAVPFRMVCILGMNDGDYPRSRPPLDFDLMASEPRVGDRSRREDDRYMFLEALLSARDRLYISWVGFNVNDNSEIPPSVLVSQLRDHLDNGWRHLNDAKMTVSQALTTAHPLHPFSLAYFSGSGPLFSYAKEWLHPLNSTESEPPLTPLRPEAAISLHALARFLSNPSQYFYEQRLGVHLNRQDDPEEDHEPFTLDALTRWGFLNTLIATRLDARAIQANEADAMASSLQRLERSGDLPFGTASSLIKQELTELVDALFERYDQQLQAWPTKTEDVVIDQVFLLEHMSVRVEDRVSSLYHHADARCRISISASKLADQQKQARRHALVRDWLLHLAGHLDGTPITTMIVGQDVTIQLAALDVATARQYFQTLLDAWQKGSAKPLPLAIKTGFKWLESGGQVIRDQLDPSQIDAADKARKVYEPGFDSPGEVGLSPYLKLAYPDFEALWSKGDFSLLCDELLQPLLQSASVMATTNNKPS